MNRREEAFLFPTYVHASAHTRTPTHTHTLSSWIAAILVISSNKVILLEEM